MTARNHKIKNFRKLAATFLVAGLGFIITPQFVHAGLGDVLADSILSIVLTAVSIVAGFASYFIGLIGSIVFQIGGFLLTMGLDLNRTLIASPVVAQGFNITLSLTNLGFVMAIIFIAFTTMLRIERYELKKLLRNLIIAAVLVNFSLAIAGSIIDFTSILAFFFIDQATAGKGFFDFATNLATAFNPQAFTIFSGTLAKTSAAAFGPDLITIVASSIFAGFFTVLLAIAMLGTAIMFLIRYVVLVILLVLMPLAWLFWIFPPLTHITGQWWSNFLKWNFFMPAATFFLYLTVVVTLNLPPATKGLPIKGNFTQEVSGIINDAFLSDVGNMVALLFLLVGGLIASEKMSIAGSKMAFSWANGVKNWAIGAAGKIGTVAKGAAIAPIKGTAINRLLSSPAWKGAANVVSKVPGFKGLAAGMYNLAEAPKRTVEEFQKELGSQSDGALLTLATAYTADPAKKAGYIREISKRGLLGEFKKKLGKAGENRVTDYLNVAKSLKAEKDILSHSVYLAPKLGLEIKALTEKMSNKDITTNQSAESFENAEFIKALEDRFQKLFANLTTAKKKAALRGLTELAKQESAHPLISFARMNPAIQGLLNRNPDLEKAFNEAIGGE